MNLVWHYKRVGSVLFVGQRVLERLNSMLNYDRCPIFDAQLTLSGLVTLSLRVSLRRHDSSFAKACQRETSIMLASKSIRQSVGSRRGRDARLLPPRTLIRPYRVRRNAQAKHDDLFDQARVLSQTPTQVRNVRLERFWTAEFAWSSNRRDLVVFVAVRVSVAKLESVIGLSSSTFHTAVCCADGSNPGRAHMINSDKTVEVRIVGA